MPSVEAQMYRSVHAWTHKTYEAGYPEGDVLLATCTDCNLRFVATGERIHGEVRLVRPRVPAGGSVLHCTATGARGLPGFGRVSSSLPVTRTQGKTRTLVSE